MQNEFIDQRIVNRLLVYPALILMITSFVLHFLNLEGIVVLAIFSYGVYIIWFLFSKIGITKDYRMIYRKRKKKESI